MIRIRPYKFTDELRLGFVIIDSGKRGASYGKATSKCNVYDGRNNHFYLWYDVGESLEKTKFFRKIR